MRLQKGFVLLPFLILIFVILIVFGASYWRGNKTSDSSEYTPQEKKTESSKIVYAKEIDSIDDSGNRRYPIYSVIQSNLDGSDKKEIFRVGDVNNYPRDFKLVKERNIVLVNMEHSLLAYNLETGERKELYQGARGQNYISSSSSPIGREFVGVVRRAIDSEVMLEVRNRLKIGETLEFIGLDNSPNTFKVDNMTSLSGEPVLIANPGMTVILKIGFQAHVNDMVRRLG